jgi:hypothetical protein
MSSPTSSQDMGTAYEQIPMYWHLSIEQLPKRYFYMELNHGWNKRYKTFITDVPITSQGNTSPRIQMEHGHVPQVLKCWNKLVSSPFKTIRQNG